MPETDLSDTIATAAAQPARVVIDGMTVEQQPLGSLIEADKYLAAKAGRAKTGLGLSFRKIIFTD